MRTHQPPHAQTPHGEHSVAEPTRRDTQAEQNAATPGGCCHKRLPTPPVTLPNVPGRAPWWFSTDDKPSSNNQSDTVCHLNIEIQEAR